ncbi:MAG: phosphotriesterase [Verrucomicrobiota bacterium]|nr:hypothetical protein [Limisphaera sp.]MDW8382734.1 phosphotriesterase [Verrucomicrobiota bacterium]
MFSRFPRAFPPCTTGSSRRSFLQWVLLLLAGCGRRERLTCPGAHGTPPQGIIYTVTGPIQANDLGPALTHEHVVTDFLGAEKAPGPRYDPELAFQQILPHLHALRARGVQALFECTPQYIGRDVRLLRRLAQHSGLRIITNTGYYGAVGCRYLPRHAFEETADQLAKRWLQEWLQSIEGTSIRPGFIKLGTDRGPLSPLHEKLLRAAARVHLQSGLTICAHTADGVAAFDQIRILHAEGVHADAFVWAHAQNGSDEERVRAARLGAWISLDGYNLRAGTPEHYVRMLLHLKQAGCWHRVLVSHDDGWAVEGEQLRQAVIKPFHNGNPVPYTAVCTRLQPDLLAAGVTARELDQLLRTNPARAFAIRVRAL